ncbi:DUF2793 domain-containing protein, partial [Zoogloea sp. 1C4]|uniref:DUF2793 domain-containing protein n=1 Tax=Zoogloea sp. 1C4 TaxID=2570190 RepID=UPI001D17948F
LGKRTRWLNSKEIEAYSCPRRSAWTRIRYLGCPGEMGWPDAYDAWEYHPPKIGWLCYVEDEAKLSAFKSTGWSAGIAI